MLSSCFRFVKLCPVCLHFKSHKLLSIIQKAKIVRFFRLKAAKRKFSCNNLIINALQKHSFQSVKAQILEAKSIVITPQYLCFCSVKAQSSPFDSIDITFLFDFSPQSLLSSLRSSTYKEANAPHHNSPSNCVSAILHSSLFTLHFHFISKKKGVSKAPKDH